jgi:nucleoside-diphosphate-sugar epimerase
MNILLTGYTGNLGAEIARQLAHHRIFALVRDADGAPAAENVTVVPGELDRLPEDLAPEIEGIIHAAASTAFRAPLAELRRINVDGTGALLAFARRCPRLRRFIHLSTTCVAGDRHGFIAEAPIQPTPGFVNAYEQSKWDAEALVLDSELPVEIARLAIVAGSDRDGSVRRPGALHHTLYWLYNGLVPMVPGAADSRVDLISTEFAAGVVAALLHARIQPGRIVHATAGDSAPMLAGLLDHLVRLFARHHRGWANDSVARPDIVDAATFALFEESVRQSGDALFRRVCDDARSFLPGLLHPRVFASSLAASAPLGDWRALADHVFTWLLTHDWGRQSVLQNAA